MLLGQPLWNTSILPGAARRWQIGAALVAGLSLTSPAQTPSAIVRTADAPEDGRRALLERFFQNKRSPLGKYSREFLTAADHNHLDWRLLPALSIVESGGGKRYIRNNVFGWGNGRARFRSISHGIAHVAARLAHAPAYAGKDVRAKLEAYNPKRRSTYPPKVLAVMAQLGPEPDPAAVAGGGR